MTVVINHDSQLPNDDEDDDEDPQGANHEMTMRISSRHAGDDDGENDDNENIGEGCFSRRKSWCPVSSVSVFAHISLGSRIR